MQSHELDKFECKQCGKYLTDKKELEDHMQTHENQNILNELLQNLRTLTGSDQEGITFDMNATPGKEQSKKLESKQQFPCVLCNEVQKQV